MKSDFVQSYKNMNKLTTLSCPSCGANLQVSSGARQIACKYCGSIHILSEIEPDAIPKVAVCPIESHQDVILKVSAIMKTQVFEAPGDPDSDNQITYRSQLAQQLFFPPRPYNPWSFLGTRGGALIVFLSFIALFAILGGVILPSFIHGSGLCGILLLILIGILITTPFARKTLIPFLSNKNDEHLKKMKQWRIAKSRWENAYYCQRHDIVFIKGEDRVIPLGSFQTFLWSEEA